MKKVVSALTAAAMCASMAAGAASVFAAYESKDMGFSLRVVSDGDFTVSADGSTITFASAAAAANASFIVGQYLECDPAQCDIQQIGGCVTVSDDLVKLPESGISLKNDSNYYSEAKEYTTADGTKFTTTAFVNCFGYINKLKKYQDDAMVTVWAHSSGWPEKWGYADANQHLIWTYASGLQAGEVEHVSFLAAKSDELPLMAFEVSLDAGIKDGTYTIDWVETYVNNYGEAQCTYFSAGKELTPVGTKKGLTIVVGEGGNDQTTPAPTQTTPAPTQTTTQAPATSDTPSTNAPATDDFVWDIGDSTVEDGVAYIDVFVANDPGTNAYGFQILVQDPKSGDWKTFADLGMEVAEITNGGAYDRMSMFAPYLAEGSVAAANDVDVNPQYADKDKAVVTYGVLVPDDMPEGVYNLKFNDLEVAAGDGKTILDPGVTQGTLIIGDAPTTQAPTTQTTPAPTQSTQPPASSTTTVKPSDAPSTNPDYLYGDVNKNGKVELVDIVMLNRYLTGYGDQDLDDYQKEVADCYDDAKHDGKDSVEILKYLIGLNTALPTKA